MALSEIPQEVTSFRACDDGCGNWALLAMCGGDPVFGCVFSKGTRADVAFLQACSGGGPSCTVIPVRDLPAIASWPASAEWDRASGTFSDGSCCGDFSEGMFL